MTEHRGFDLEGQASRAWKSFAARLADHIAGMREGDVFTIRLAGLVEAESPTITFAARPNAEVRCTVEVPARVLRSEDIQRRSEQGLETALTGLGWWVAGKGPAGQWSSDVLHARRDMALREADALSALTVRVLYDALGALHPVFLRVSGDADLVDYSAAGADRTTDDEPPQVTQAVGSDHLRELVLEAVALELGRQPAVDADGDVMVQTGHARVFVRVLERTPSIQMFARLVHAVAHPAEAPSVVLKLNAEYSFIKFMYADEAVLATVHLPADPFVPVQVRRMLATFVEIAEQLGEDLRERLGGEPEIARPDPSVAAAAAAEDLDAIPPELVTLLGMDPDGVGLDPEVTAGVCGFDRALAWQLLHIAGGQEDVWRTAMQETDDPDQEAKCAEEASGWKATRRSLTDALELINARSR